MSSELRHLVDRGLLYPVVRLSGVLDVSTGPTVRSVLIDELATQPEALVVDVADLHADTLDVLRAIREDTRDWPASHLALCGVRDAALWRDADWPSWPAAADAFSALGNPEQGGRLRLELEPQVGAARHARELITEACLRWELPELAGPGCIVVTELVNNVIAHAKTPMVVLLGVHGDVMSVAVRDQSTVVPSFDGEPVPVTAYGGRGMLLIDSVAERWGCLAVSDGKVVWAQLGGE